MRTMTKLVQFETSALNLVSKLDVFLKSQHLKLIQSNVGKDLIVAVYVDDLKTAARNMTWMNQVKEDLSKEFNIIDLSVTE